MRTEKISIRQLPNVSAIIKKATDLFMRMTTNQAEIVATVMFATDILKKKDKVIPTETEVLESVMQWKQKRRPPLDRLAVAPIIRNLGILRWLDVKPDTALPISENEYMFRRERSLPYLANPEW